MIFHGEVINIISRDNTTNLWCVSSLGLFTASLNCHIYTLFLELLFSLQIHCYTSFLFGVWMPFMMQDTLVFSKHYLWTFYLNKATEWLHWLSPVPYLWLQVSKAESLPRALATVCDSGSTSVCFPLLRVLGRFFNAIVQTLLPVLVILFPSSLLQPEIAQCDCCVKQCLLLFLWKLLLASFNSPQYWQAEHTGNSWPFPFLDVFKSTFN